MFGKLTLADIPLDQPIIMGTCLVLLLAIAAVLAYLTVAKKWLWLWREWLTTVDHKRIGIMYCLLAAVMLLRGFSDAVMMRSQQALASHDHAGFLVPEHYDQVFSAHGTIYQQRIFRNRKSADQQLHLWHGDDRRGSPARRPGAVAVPGYDVVGCDFPDHRSA